MKEFLKKKKKEWLGSLLPSLELACLSIQSVGFLRAVLVFRVSSPQRAS